MHERSIGRIAERRVAVAELDRDDPVSLVGADPGEIRVARRIVGGQAADGSFGDNLMFLYVSSSM